MIVFNVFHQNFSEVDLNTMAVLMLGLTEVKVYSGGVRNAALFSAKCLLPPKRITSGLNTQKLLSPRTF